MLSDTYLRGCHLMDLGLGRATHDLPCHARLIHPVALYDVFFLADWVMGRHLLGPGPASQSNFTLLEYRTTNCFGWWAKAQTHNLKDNKCNFSIFCKVLSFSIITSILDSFISVLKTYTSFCLFYFCIQSRYGLRLVYHKEIDQTLVFEVIVHIGCLFSSSWVMNLSGLDIWSILDVHIFFPFANFVLNTQWGCGLCALL